MRAEAFPLTAWEQAVVLCLFISFVGGLLAWFGAQLKNQREAQFKQQDDWRAAIKDLNLSWQAFIHDERLTTNTQRKEDRDRIERIELVLEKLANETASFRADFSVHAAEEMTRYDTIMEMTRKNDQAARKSRGGA